MNHFIQGIIKIALIEAQVGLLVVDRLLPQDRFARHRRTWFVALAALMVLAWCNFGGLRGRGSLVHGWEQFHFYLGAKYQQEVGWFDLYKAAVLADREAGRALDVQQIRDIRTFELVPVEQALADAPRVRARFSDARWAEFKDDWQRMLQRPGNWAATLQDHGNSNSPAWSVLAHPIASLVPLTAAGQTFLGLLDMVLMAILWWVAFNTFGFKAASVGLFMWAVPPNTFDYLAGSFLRWDWLFALGMAVCFMKRGRWATAGAFYGYAIASKLFPIFFAVPLLFRAALALRREGSLAPRYRRFALGTLGAGLGFVLAAAAMFGSFGVWREYQERIEVARVEKFYSIQYSLRTVYLQVAESRDGEVLREGLWPKDLKQALPEVDIAQHAWPFLLVKLFFTAAVLLLALRAGDVEAFTLGPLLVFTWLVVNMYYWNMLGLTALGLALRSERQAFAPLLGLHGIFAFFYLYQHTNHGFSEGFAVAALLAAGILAAAAYELIAIRGRWTEFLGPASA